MGDRDTGTVNERKLIRACANVKGNIKLMSKQLGLGTPNGWKEGQLKRYREKA